MLDASVSVKNGKESGENEEGESRKRRGQKRGRRQMSHLSQLRTFGHRRSRYDEARLLLLFRGVYLQAEASCMCVVRRESLLRLPIVA